MPTRSVTAKVVLSAGLILSAVAIPVVARTMADPRVLRAAFQWHAGLKLIEPTDSPLQTKRYDCGPAALAELLRRRGIAVTSERLEELAGTTPSGTTMLGLQRAAAAVGAESQGMILRFDDLQRVPLPLLVFVRGRHFVLVTAADTAAVHLLDPAIGRVQVGRAQFLREWHGESLVFQTGALPTSGRR
jgi:ABC-type bacteriocin/lantibiotic exporter with double-glycine peptidase domain